MPYTLDEFAADCRAALRAAPDEAAGVDAVRGCVERALLDKDFLAAHLGPGATSPRHILYEDPELGFCIIAHVYDGAKASDPHDHGPTWAVYGQAEGTTEMTDWRMVTPPDGAEPGRVEKVRTYTLSPGQAQAYRTGDIHSPRREGATRLIRVEGKNTDNFERERYEPVA